ncbi:MAG: Maf family protein [Acidobacteria bacterium]|nr:Maf family protein [Acidobacteriota bacterium]MCB9396503.1 Maf family protein [Acidobacteriota bacterium]
MNPILVATTSKYKKAQLAGLGLALEWAAPEYDEPDLPHLPADQVAAEHALLKAESLLDRFPNHLIIGLDQTLILDGQILRKPGTVERAVAQLSAMSGKTHQLHTAFALAQKGKPTETRTIVANLTLLPDLTAHFLKAMVERDETWDCAGAYKIEASACTILERVECDDPSSIIGVPLIALCRSLAQRGYFPTRQRQAETS